MYNEKQINNHMLVLNSSKEIRGARIYYKLLNLEKMTTRSFKMCDEWKNDPYKFLDYIENIKSYRYPNVFIKQSSNSEFIISPETIVFSSRTTNKTFINFLYNKNNAVQLDRILVKLRSSLISNEKIEPFQADIIISNWICNSQITKAVHEF